jgi:hypothetical protein
MLLGMLLYDPRLVLGGIDFPPDVVAVAIPQTEGAKRISTHVSISTFRMVFSETVRPPGE